MFEIIGAIFLGLAGLAFAAIIIIDQIVGHRDMKDLFKKMDNQRKPT